MSHCDRAYGKVNELGSAVMPGKHMNAYLSNQHLNMLLQYVFVCTYAYPMLQ